MKYTILTFVLAVGSTLPMVAQVSNSTTEHKEDHAATQVNPDGTAVQSKATKSERNEATTNPDGSTNTTRSRSESKKVEKKESPAVSATPTDSTVDHHSSTSTTTTDTVKP